MNVSINLERAALYFPEHPAVFDGDRMVPYGRLDRDARRIASALSRLGVAPGDSLALCLPNSYEWIAFYFGALKAGAVIVTFSCLASSGEVRGMIADTRPKVLFTTDEKYADLGAEAPAYLPLVVCNTGDLSFSMLLEKGTDHFQTVERQSSDTAAVLYTGGTTGSPKGAMLSHGNLLTSAFNVAHYERSGKEMKALLCLPLNHVFAQVHIMHSFIFAGGGLVVQNGFDMQRAVDAIARHQITNFYAVPTLFIRFLRMTGLREKFASVRYCFSAASSMAVEVMREWQEVTGLTISEAYGLTESASMVTYNHYHRHVPGSIGTPVNMVEVQIRDPQGNVLPAGEQGEICIRGANIFKGYLGSPEETAASFWGEWLRSGDIGAMDKDGYFYILDRLKDLVKTGGENVYPREVEEVLYAWPQVAECAVVGLPDREYGERVAAFLVLRNGDPLDRAALKAFAKTRLPGFKVPKEFVVVDSLPKNSAGKVLKRELRRESGTLTCPR